MKTRTLALSLAVLTVAPAAADAQGFGIAGRAGTLGLGGEAHLALTDRVNVRAGAGVWPDEIAPEPTFDDLTVELGLPTTYNVGLDLYLNNAFRLGGGVLFRDSDPEVTGRFDSPQEIGGQTFTPGEIGTLLGVIDSNDKAPYVLIGFGNPTTPGFGLMLDLGVAFMGDPDVRLDAQGGSLDADQEPLRSELDQEAQQFEDDMRTYLKIWPILSLGLRFGF